MKQVARYPGSSEMVMAVQNADLERLAPVIEQAKQAWFDAWVRDGRQDRGSSILGVGISVWYLPPRARRPQRHQIIYWGWCQGDLEASRLKRIPMDILRDAGLEPMYDCGVMD